MATKKEVDRAVKAADKLAKKKSERARKYAKGLDPSAPRTPLGQSMCVIGSRSGFSHRRGRPYDEEEVKVACGSDAPKLEQATGIAADARWPSRKQAEKSKSDSGAQKTSGVSNKATTATESLDMATAHALAAELVALGCEARVDTIDGVQGSTVIKIPFVMASARNDAAGIGSTRRFYAPFDAREVATKMLGEVRRKPKPGPKPEPKPEPKPAPANRSGSGWKASPAKLKDGSWGARIQGNPSAGDAVTVTTKGGKSWAATVNKVVWQGRDKAGRMVALVSTSGSDSGGAARRPQAARRKSSSSSRRCRECRGPIKNAPHHVAMGGLCGYCAFDEYDN